MIAAPAAPAAPAEPAAPAAVAAVAAVPAVVAQNGPMCVICCEPMAQGTAEALECTHVFHTACPGQAMCAFGPPSHVPAPYWRGADHYLFRESVVQRIMIDPTVERRSTDLKER